MKGHAKLYTNISLHFKLKAFPHQMHMTLSVDTGRYAMTISCLDYCPGEGENCEQRTDCQMQIQVSSKIISYCRTPCQKTFLTEKYIYYLYTGMHLSFLEYSLHKYKYKSKN